MGRAKEEWLRQQELGYSSAGEKYVCAECFEDYAIKEFVENQNDTETCTYCDGGHATHLDHVLEFMAEGIRSEWGEAVDEGIAWESREGGWQWNVLNSYELLFEEIGLEVGLNLGDDIASAFIDLEWVEKNPYMLRPEQTLIFGWQNFSELVKHKTRYVFYRSKTTADEDQPDEIEPRDILDEIGRAAINLNLCRTLNAGITIYRIRIIGPGVKISTAQELGTPPIEYARFSNRMSPAGIPMFYGALDRETAVAETYVPVPGSTQKLITGNFISKTDLSVLDLTVLDGLPSLFDESYRHLRSSILFLQEFIFDLSKQVIKDGREHIDYVPTQIVTEYFRHLFHTREDSPVDRLHGIIYPSSRHQDGKACVLFASAEQCVEPDDPQPTEDDPILILQNIEEEIVSVPPE